MDEQAGLSSGADGAGWRRRLSVLLVALVAALGAGALTGCGDDEDTDEAEQAVDEATDDASQAVEDAAGEADEALEEADQQVGEDEK